jgi:hypothetical protein
LRPRFVIVDRSLKDERGHHYALSSVITEGARQHDLDIVWWTNAAFPKVLTVEGAATSGIFSTSIYDPFVAAENSSGESKPQNPYNEPRDYGPLLGFPIKFAGRVYRSIRYRLAVRGIGNLVVATSDPDEPARRPAARLVDELANGIDDLELGEGDHIFVHTADGDIYRSVLDLILERRPNRGVPYIHLATPFDIATMPHYKTGLTVERVVRYYRTFGLIGNQIFLYAENGLLADELSKIWDVPVTPLNLPPPIAANAQKPARRSTLRVAYLGAARAEKGFNLLPEVIRTILNSELPRPAIQFVIQCHPQIVGYSEEIKATIAELKMLPQDCVQLIEAQQSMHDYYAVLRDVDVVWTCYDSNKYRVRGSGIAVEAISFGNIIIATPDSFPAQIAEEAGVLAEGAIEIARAILTIHQDTDVYRRRANKRRIRYMRSHSAANYIATILSMAYESSDDHNRRVEKVDKALHTVGASDLNPGWEQALERAKGTGHSSGSRLLGRNFSSA